MSKEIPNQLSGIKKSYSLSKIDRIREKQEKTAINSVIRKTIYLLRDKN